MKMRSRTGVVCLSILMLVVAPTTWAIDSQPNRDPGILEPLIGVFDWLAEQVNGLLEAPPSEDPTEDPPEDPPVDPDPDEPDDEKGPVHDPGGNTGG